MKKLSLILSLLCLTCSMSFGQILQWTQTITAPSPGANPDTITSASKITSASALRIYWNNGGSPFYQIIWFGSKGSILHSDTLDPNYYNEIYGLSSTRLVLKREGDNGAVFITYTRKGSVVTKTEIDSGVYSEIDRFADEAGFFKIEKGEGKTWILKRYIF